MSFDVKIVNGDFKLANGDLATITGKDKLIQDVLKICLTDPGALPYATWFGSFASRTAIGSILDNDITLSVAKNQLQNALENLKKLQQLQVSQGTQSVLPEEQIAAITEVVIARNVNEPRLISVKLGILNKTFNKVSTTFNL